VTRVRRARIALGVLMGWASGVTVAQSAPAAGADSAHTCQPDLVARDTIREVIYAALPPAVTEPRDVQILRGTVYQEFLDRFRNPPGVYYTDIVRNPLALQPVSHPLGFGEVRFTVAADGRVSGLQFAPGTPSERFDSAFARAAALLDSARIPFATSDARDTLQMRIVLNPDENVGLMPVPIIVGHLVTLRMTPAGTTVMVTPRYPASLEQQRLPGYASLRFIVRTDGRALMSSVKIVASSRQEFVEVVLAVLPRYRFTPASLGGCPVDSWVGLPFQFRVP
jgi:hypothetical protein